MGINIKSALKFKAFFIFDFCRRKEPQTIKTYSTGKKKPDKKILKKDFCRKRKSRRKSHCSFEKQKSKTISLAKWGIPKKIYEVKIFFFVVAADVN